MGSRCLSWLHIGDLHACDTDGWLGVERLGAVLGEVDAALAAGEVDFVYLPGDNANEGKAAQYDRLRQALTTAKPPAPLQVIPGDHDFVPRNLQAFGAFLDQLGVEPPPRSVMLKGRRVLLLDIVSAGTGGPDFQLGAKQTDWMDRELEAARREDAWSPVVLMHAFPGDLARDAIAIEDRFAAAGVALVDTGHTHYNEVINDGRVVYAAARSTAQIEEEGEDAFGVTFLAVDGDEASFRFRRAGSGWPLVMITSPADQRLQVRRTPLDDQGRLCVRAKVFGAGRDVEVSLEVLGRTIPMARVEGETGLWSATVEKPWRETIAALPPPQRRVDVRVRARSSTGVGEDVIRLGAKIASAPPGRSSAGGGSIGVWPEHGLMGSRLGPNVFGKDW